ncbi:unnamed protein product [uncultured virus]|nr:unnamed protein product [uncultured virus]
MKDEIMKQGLRYKIDENSDLKARILAVGDKKLVEHSLKDYHYGCC